jgi:hypothetical protein
MTTAAAEAPGSLAAHWTALATVALLGTDRRAVPAPPDGPVAALVAAAAPTDDADAVLVQVAALAAARRGGVRPAPALAPLPACPEDGRPECPPAAAHRLDELIGVWPELIDEWLARATASGYRLPAVQAVALLGRFRTDPVRRPAIEVAAGPLVGWLAALFPGQFAPRRTAVPPAATAPDVDAFPLPPDLAPLLDAPADTVVTTLVDGLTAGRLVNRHRAVLVHLVRRLPPDVLLPLAEGLSRAATNPNTLGLTMSMADFARTRAALIAELLPPTTPTESPAA